jgi:hypothetical protein
MVFELVKVAGTKSLALCVRYQGEDERTSLALFDAHTKTIEFSSNALDEFGLGEIKYTREPRNAG